MAARKTHLAFLLHMHQPLYVDPRTGRVEMPWVRLHAGRGYLDVAYLLDKHPAVSLTVNFVPSLVEQLELCAGGGTDTYLEVATRPEWTPEDRRFLLQYFFSVNWGRGIDPRPRYRELLDKRGRNLGPGDLEARAREFSDGELRDLTVLFHLAWLGFAARANDPTIAEIEAKERNFSAEDFQQVVERSRRACSEVLPLYRKLAERGQVEISSSPYYHPIIPMVIDTEAARRSMPNAQLPDRFAWASDARAQIARGRDYHARVFGAPPSGMWPPEGSVSPEAVAAYRAEKIGWLATDEGNLWRSLEGDHPRGDLYRPYTFDGIDLVFRDRELSDRIGFSYAFGDARSGVDDLLGRVRHAGGIATTGANEPPLVSVILDGENPWEAYPGSGEPFLENLFSSLETSEDLRAVSIGGHLRERRERTPLSRLHSGSWIETDFHIWIGDPVKNRAWNLLGRARRRWQRASESNTPSERLEKSLTHLLAAEGSDWFWWFGEPFNSAEDGTFDRLFRAHLAAAWEALGDVAPSELEEPVARVSVGPNTQRPRDLVSPKVDGKVGNYFEWIDAGRYDVPQGAAMAEAPIVTTLYFGSDTKSLFVRLDPTEAGRARLRSLKLELLLRAGAREVELSAAGGANAFRVRERSTDGDAPFTERASSGALALAEILEASAPFVELGFAPGTWIDLTLRLYDGDVVLGRFPRDGHLALVAPDENFAADHWSV